MLLINRISFFVAVDTVGCLWDRGQGGIIRESQRQPTMTFTLPAALVSDTIEQLMGHLATAARAKEEAEAEYNRLRAELTGIMIAADKTSERTVWGLASLVSGRKSVVYTDKIKLMEVKIKAAKAAEEISGKATVSHGEQSIRVTWAK